VRLSSAAIDVCRRAQQLFFIGLSLDAQEATQVLTLAYLKGVRVKRRYLYITSYMCVY
jgi:hypothetical protein